MDINDVIPAVNCTVKMQRNGDTFQVSIVGDDGRVFQNLDSYNILDGDVLQLNGLGFRVTFDGIEWNPPHKSNKVDMPTAYLKRKMDIENGSTKL